MINPKEIAEKVVENYYLGESSKKYTRLVSLIIGALRSYGEECVKEARDSDWKSWLESFRHHQDEAGCRVKAETYVEFGKLIGRKMQSWETSESIINRAKAEARAEALEELERRVIPTRPEANMLGTLTYLRLQEEIRALLAKRKEN